MVTVVLTPDQCERLLFFMRPLCERWPAETVLNEARIAVDNALLAWEERPLADVLQFQRK